MLQDVKKIIMEIIRLEYALISDGRYWRCLMSGKYPAWSNLWAGAVGYGNTMQEAMLVAAQSQIKAHNIAALRDFGLHA